MLNFNLCCVAVGKGAFYAVVFCNAIFPNSELNTKSLSCQTNGIWKNIFIDNIYNVIFSKYM